MADGDGLGFFWLGLLALIGLLLLLIGVVIYANDLRTKGTQNRNALGLIVIGGVVLLICLFLSLLGAGRARRAARESEVIQRSSSSPGGSEHVVIARSTGGAIAPLPPRYAAPTEVELATYPSAVPAYAASPALAAPRTIISPRVVSTPVATPVAAYSPQVAASPYISAPCVPSAGQTWISPEQVAGLNFANGFAIDNLGRPHVAIPCQGGYLINN